MIASNIIFRGWGLWWLWLSLAALTAVGVILLYRYERRLVAVRVGNTLLGLRLAAVVILFFALLQPVIAVVGEKIDERRILVAVDVSQSMQTSDPQASDAEKLRWARAVGAIGNAAIDGRLDEWQHALDRDQQPQWVASEEDGGGETAARLAQTRRDNLRKVLNEIGELQRREIVERLLTATTAPLLRELQRIADVRTVLFADKSIAVYAESLSLSDDIATRLGLNDGVTDIRAGIAADRSAVDTAGLTAIVLFTDGRDTTSHDPIAVARAWGRDGVAVFPVMIGSPRPPVDITITDLDYPASVFLGDTPRLTATLGTTGFEGRDIEVVLQPATGTALRKTVAVDAATTDIQFDWPAEAAGRHSFTITAMPQPEELRDDNNSAEFALTVVDDTVRVLLIEEEARWEFRFIDNAYRRDSRVDVSQVVFEQPFLEALDATFFPRRLDWPDDPAAWDKTTLAETDLVIVGDVSPTFMTPRMWETLERFVDAGRGTLMLLAGKNQLMQGDIPSALEMLLPVSDLRVVQFGGEAAKGSPTQRGFHLRLTPEGEREPMLQFAADLQTNREIWHDFPGHTWGMTGTAKPGASVLATIVPPTDHQPADAEEERAVMVRQAYGLGQVLWLGVDSTWRWRHRAGDKYHHRFWGQLARWAARHRSLGGSDSVKFGFERSEIAQGEPAVLRARFSRVFLQRFPQVRATADIFTAGDLRPVQSVSLKPAPGRPLAFEGRALDLPPGEYTARLKVDEAELGVEDLSAALFISPPATQELIELSANAELLSQIAKVSGGRLIHPHELADLPRQLVSVQESREDAGEVAIWQHPLFLVVFCALVTAEWVVRKLNGLP